MMETLWQDLRYGIRTLWKNPGFTSVVVLTLALGIGANTAIFGVVNALLLRPLPYRDSQQLVHIRWLWPSDWVDMVSGLEFDYWKERSRVFDAVAACQLGKGFNLSAGPEPEYVKGNYASASFFRVLGVNPVLGRGFLPQEDRPGGERVVILTHDLWSRRFAADAAIDGTGDG